MEETVATEILFTHEVAVVTNHFWVAHTVSFTHEIGHPKNLSVTDSVTFSHTIGMQILNYSVTSDVAFTQTILCSIHHFEVAHTITFDHDVSKAIDPIREAVVDNIIFDQDVSTAGSTVSRDVEHDVTFTHSVTRNYLQSVAHTVTFSHTAIGLLGTSHTVTFDHDVDVTITRHVSSTITLTPTITINKVISLSVSHTVTFEDSVIQILATHYANHHCEYAPIIGRNSTMPASAPVTSLQSNIILRFPHNAPTTTVTLRAVDFGNTESKNYSRILRETRGGTLKAYRRSVWPKNTGLKYTVSFNSHQQVLDFIALLDESLGQRVKLTDHLNRDWVGVLIPDDYQMTHMSRSNRQLSFGFEGDLL